MKRTFTKLMAALALLLFIAPLGMKGQSTTYTSNVTLPQSGTYVSSCTVKINGTEYDGTKLGKNGSGASTNVTIPAGTTTLYVHCAAWNGKNSTLALSTTQSGVSITPSGDWTLTYDTGIANSSPFTLATPSNAPTSYFREYTLTGVTSNITVKFEAKSERAVFWGVNAVAGGTTYTIAALSNNTDYGTVDLSGSVITGTPKPGCRYASPAYTVSPANSATVAQNGNNFTVTPSDNTTVTINFEAIPSHTATFSVNNDNELTTSSQVIEGAAITFPADPDDIGDMTFMGWTTTAISGTQPAAPTFVNTASETMGSSDVTFYAVFAEVGEGGPDTYEKLNSNSFDANAKYVIGAAQSSTDNTMWYYRSIDNNWGRMTSTPETNAPVKFTLSGSASALVAKDDNGGYLKGLTSGSFEMSTSSTTIALTSSGTIRNSNSGSYYLRHNYNSGNGGLRWYNSNTGTSAYFYKVIPGVTYSNYCTTIVVSTDPSITANPATIEIAADEMDGTTDVIFANLEIVDPWENCHVTFYDATGTTEVPQPDWVIKALVAEDGDAYLISCAVYANEGPARTAYFKVYAKDENDIAVYSNLVTLSQAGYVMPSSVETWELTTLSELTADDVFVIVCYDEDLETSYAMANDNGTSAAPSAVVVTVENDALTTTPADNLKWNVVSTENGYIFYPYGSSETWLYCNNSNNGVRVGTGNAKHFTIDGVSGYLTTTETTQQRYLGVYTEIPDWRCYDGTSGNISNQTFAFYKKVAAPTDTNTKTILPYSSDRDHYYLIASPVMAVVPSAENGFLTNNYDLYRFDQSRKDEEWLNYEVTPFYLLSGKGYLYANSGNGGNATTITFTGVPYNGTGEVTLSKVPNVKFSGWNLIGNPWNNEAILKDVNDQSQAYYTINQINNEVAAGMLGASISAMEGVFVLAAKDGDVVTFEEQTPDEPNSGNTVSQLSINVSKSRGQSIDRAIVRFDNGNQLPKFQLNPKHTKVYFQQDNKDYAVVRSANEGEMPVNFKAETRGTYTINVEAENVEMSYLHLFDNKTGADIDLLATPSYTFQANSSDYESRFRLVFNANAIEENDTEANTTFAYFNGSEWVINNPSTGSGDNATLQVIDMMGRVLSSETLNGNANVTLNQAAGIYVLRLVNGENVKVQKVVVR